MEPGLRGDGELHFFPFVLIIITAALCQHTKHNLHFGKEFHQDVHNVPSSTALHPNCSIKTYWFSIMLRPHLNSTKLIWFYFLFYLYVGVIFMWIINTIVCHGNLSYFILGFFSLNGSSSVCILQRTGYSRNCYSVPIRGKRWFSKIYRLAP